MDIQRTYYTGAPRRRRMRWWMYLTAMAACMLQSLSAQNLISNGTLTNTGTIRVKNQAVIVQGNVGGEIELIGADQNLPAKQYQNVRLSGTGTKTTTGGNLSILGNLTVAAPVTLNITQGNIVTLSGTLFESGILKGAIQKSVNLTGSTTSSNFGNIGATISWNSTSPGMTTVVRVSDSLHTGNSNESIKRYYAVRSADSTSAGDLTLEFSDSELNGHDLRLLQLWHSSDNGQNWYYQGGTVDTLLRAITKSNAVLSGRWTMADTLHPIGTFMAPGIPTTMIAVNTNQAVGAINTQAAPFAVALKDAFNNPVKNKTVTFSVDSIPSGGSRPSLSDTVAITDSLGIAGTSLTFGNKAGMYYVRASANTLPPVLFTAKALHGPASAVTLVKGNNQSKKILTALDSSFTVSVVDVGGNPVDSATVQFVISSAPAGATGEQLSAQTVLTDTLGRAATVLTLGDKVGEYIVSAAVSGVTGPPIQFSAEAIPGDASQILLAQGNNQAAVNGKQLATPFTVVVLDNGSNPVEDDTVHFSISSAPAGAIGHALSATTVVTSASGQASSYMTLGNKTGEYTVVVNSASLPGVLVFRSVALANAPSTITASSGNNQTAPVNAIIANTLRVAVFDSSGNAVPSARVTFAITGLPAGATGQTVSPAETLTDTNGIAQTVLTLGNKTGAYKVSATVNGLPSAEFSATAIPGNPSVLTAVAGAGQTDQILNRLGAPLVVSVLDASENAVPQTPVTFAITSTPVGAVGTAISDSALLTDSLGRASIMLTLGSKVGTYEVSAIIAGIDTVLFTTNATHGAAALFTDLVGQNQIKPTGAPLDTAFVLSVRDIGDNPVPNAPVRFAVISAPANAIEYSLSDSIRNTDSSGIAYTYLQLGDREGTYVVGASTQGAPQAQFTASGYYIYGDINRDFFVNIADITSIIDFFNKKKVLSATDSLKADFDRDGNIEIADLDSIREHILSRGIPTAAAQPSPAKAESSLIRTRNNGSVWNMAAISEASALLETTPLGLRVNLQNAIPVRGMELRIKLNDSTVNINSVNLTTHRGKGKNVFVRTVDHEVRLLVYNLSNAEISPDTGSLFRLPGIYALGAIDTSQAILALQSNTAAVSNVFLEVARPGKYPTTFSLGQNYPNPFNGSTTIEYDIADDMKGSKIILQVFNILGQRIKTLVTGEQDPGHYKVRWDSTNDAGISVASGVYFYRFLTKDHGGSRKMLYIK